MLLKKQSTHPIQPFLFPPPPLRLFRFPASQPSSYTDPSPLSSILSSFHSPTHKHQQKTTSIHTLHAHTPIHTLARHQPSTTKTKQQPAPMPTHKQQSSGHGHEITHHAQASSTASAQHGDHLRQTQTQGRQQRHDQSQNHHNSFHQRRGSVVGEEHGAGSAQGGPFFMKPLTKQPDYRFNLYVKGLAPTTTTRSLYELFKPYVFSCYYAIIVVVCCGRETNAIIAGDGIKKSMSDKSSGAAVSQLLLMLRPFIVTDTVHVHASCSDRYFCVKNIRIGMVISWLVKQSSTTSLDSVEGGSFYSTIKLAVARHDEH